MKNKMLVLVIISLLLIGLAPFGGLVKAGEGYGLDNPNFQKGPQPFVPLTAKEKKLKEEKLQKYREWLSKQPEDINPLDIPLKTNRYSVSSLSIEEGEISIPVRTQERSYWCGPAAAQEVLDYDWGYLSTVSKYSQSFLADEMGTSATEGTYVYKLTNALNQYKQSSFYWTYTQVSSDETNAANEIYNKTKGDISDYEGLIYHVDTYPCYGYDTWGERHGLIGYYDPYSQAGHSTGHYVVGCGYIQYNSGKHSIRYIDSNSYNYGWGSPLGRHTVSARVMATCVIGNQRYIIW